MINHILAADYTDYHHAMQHAAHALTNNNQLHPAMAQIPMSQMLSAGLNLTVSSPNQVPVRILEPGFFIIFIQLLLYSGYVWPINK